MEQNTSPHQPTSNSSQQSPSKSKQYLTTNLKCPDTYIFTSHRGQDSISKQQSTPPINIYQSKTPYFVINEKNCDFTKEINSQFKCNILICRGCELLLGYKTFIVEKEKHFLTLSALLNYRIDPEADNDHFLYVYCMGCNEELGIRIKNSYYIYSSMVCEKNRIMTAAIISLKKDINDDFEHLLKSINNHLNLQITIHHFHLQKSQLQNFKLQFNYDICLVIHKEEGRLLLFDENGMYNHVFRECFNNTKGNVLFMLLMSDYHYHLSSLLSNTNNFNGSANQTKIQANGTDQLDNQKSKQLSTSDMKTQSSTHSNEGVAYSTNSNPIWDKNLIKDIAENGKQPLLYLLSKNQLVMTIIEQISILQINFLMNFIHNSQYKPLVPSEMNFKLGFTKRYLKINIEKCQKAILSYFSELASKNSEYNEVVSYMQQQSSSNQQYQKSSLSLDTQSDQQTQDESKAHTSSSSVDSIQQKCTIF